MKSFRYFTEYVNASTPAFAVGGASTGPGMGQYSPVADLNAQKKKQRRVKQDPDIKDSPGTEPAKYYAKDASGKGMAKSTKQARDRHFTKGAAKDDDDPSAYKPAPGDKGAKTKLSKYTKKYRKMYGENFTQKMVNDLEKFADRILAKFGIDVQFTKHFVDRLNDPRNDPAIKTSELQRFFKKIQRNKGKNIINNPDIEAVLKDIKTNLNLPVAIKKKGDRYIVTNKTIMRKKDFKTTDRVFSYEDGHTQKYRKVYGEDAEDDELARDMAAAQRKMQGAREKKRLKVRHKTQMDRLKTATPDEKKDLKTRQDAESKANAIAIKRDIENIRRTEGLWDNIRKKKERIKRGSGEKMRKPGEKGAPTPAQLKRAQEDFELNEKIEGLVKKSEKSGIAYGILKKVYSRGMAAWRTGHRPGTTPQQWAFARVNSFITGGGARKSDADLWRQHKGK